MMVLPQAGGRLTSENAPLVLLIQNAYSLQSFQIVGGPAWINTDGYDLEAKPAASVSREQMWLMLQSLLADRFKLAAHRDRRELAVYELTADRRGLKLSAPKEGGCVDAAPGGPLPPPGTLVLPCGRMLVKMSPSGLSLLGGKIRMAELTRILASVMGKPVIDKTGYTAEFDLQVTGITPDETTAGLPGSGGPRDPGGLPLPTDPNRPNILTALQEQAGLKLSSGKSPAEVLVIDHVERPTTN
jgi:uncharacterized protein (TIGR03435 family)